MEKDLLKKEQKIERKEIEQSSSKKKGLIAGAIAGSAVALALGFGLGFGLQSPNNFDINVSSTTDRASVTGNGNYKIGDEVTLEAESIDGYKFIGWNFNEHMKLFIKLMLSY